MKQVKQFVLLGAVLLGSITANAQCKAIADACDDHITAEYIPDGQFHFAMLKDQETAEFGMVLFGGTTYRIAACSGLQAGNLFFTVYDKNHEEIFSNIDHGSAPYWDFVVENTVEVIIEANLDNTKAASGCAVVSVGFKK